MMPRSVPQTGQPKRRFSWPKGMPQIIALILVLMAILVQICSTSSM